MNKSFLHFVILAAICTSGASWGSKALAHAGTDSQRLPYPFSLPPVRESDVVILERRDPELFCPEGSFAYDNCHGLPIYEDCQSIHRYTCKPFNPLSPDLFDPLNPDLKPRDWSPLEDEGLPLE
jgi:hypothetical protein